MTSAREEGIQVSQLLIGGAIVAARSWPETRRRTPRSSPGSSGTLHDKRDRFRFEVATG